jgi:membrane-associated phospholipid phosphatase
MKQCNNNKYWMTCALALGLLAGCSKSITERAEPGFEPQALDANGGTWKTVVLANSGEVAVPAPDAVGSAAYQAELNEILRQQGAIGTADNQLIADWQGSGVIKWNAVARELVAKYNLPPEANPDGSYPVPSAANPGAYPLFPFANPPYASRAYAHFSVALYDALASCWRYKFQYNRMAPAINDARLKRLEPLQQGLPSYPSEDAVVAQVSYRLLKQFFPLDSSRLLQLANGQKRAKLLSGAATPSDVAAADVIANYVADKVINRSRTDGMGAAVGNPTLWAQLESAAVGRGITVPWKSLETPARPPMLPFFGNVQLWNLNSFQRDSLRPGPPPAIGSAAFNQALEEVKQYALQPSGNTWHIALYWADGVSTYTPPGHWNEIACALIAANRLSELRAARTLSLMNMAAQDAGICCWDTKSYYYYPRPSQIDGRIKTIGLPNFPSYTSGHSTFSGAAATVLGYVFPQERANMEAMAKEASLSRLYGGIHYRFDCDAGLAAGNTIGTFSVKRGMADGS